MPSSLRQTGPLAFGSSTAASRRRFTPFTSFPPTPWALRHRETRTVLRATSPEDASGSDGGLSSVFNQFVLVKGITSPAAAAQRTHPSPLMPPTAVLEHTLTVLQRNDWPEADAGVRAAYHLTLPYFEDPGAVRSWQAEEEWLPWPRFHAQLHVSYGALVNCDSWRVISPLVFPSSRHDNRAVQAVEVRARPRHAPPSPPPPPPESARTNQGRSLDSNLLAGLAARTGAPGVQEEEEEDRTEQGGSGSADRGFVDMALRSYQFTFCLERQEQGPYKDCWLIAGVRAGNYAL